MSEVILVANRAKLIPFRKECDYIGIDAGAMYCLKHQIPMTCAIGDFDSIDEIQLQNLKTCCEVIQLPVMKDQVDSEYALNYAHQQGYDKISIYGVIGGRQDHFIAMIQLLKKSTFPFTIWDEQNTIYCLEKGRYRLKKKRKYLSFFACEPLTISISGVKYPLHNRKITENDIYLVSNEILEKEATLEVDGKVLVLECDNK